MVGNEHKVFLRTFYSGADTSLDAELLGAQDTGKYIDQQNFRPNSDTQKGRLEAIGGESVYYLNDYSVVPNPEDFEDIGSIVAGGNQFTIWAYKYPTVDLAVNPAYVTINGQVALRSQNFTVNVDHKFQLSKNDGCEEGEVFATDYNNPPLIFNIKDMLDNITTDKYFASFVMSDLYLQVNTYNDVPRFKGFADFGKAAGMLVGSYAYQVRLISASGDATNISLPTPPIKIPLTLDDKDIIYPGYASVGAPVGFTSRYAPTIIFRVSNPQGYDFIEIIRHDWNSGQPTTVTPVPQVIAKIPISSTTPFVVEFTDVDSPYLLDPPVPLTVEDLQVKGVIKRCKAIRYFRRRVYLLNIEYQSLDIPITLKTFDDSGQCSGNTRNSISIIQGIGKQGHKDPYNATYYKGYQSNEVYYLGVVGFYPNFVNTFVTPVPDTATHDWGRRNAIDTCTERFSYDRFPGDSNGTDSAGRYPNVGIQSLPVGTSNSNVGAQVTEIIDVQSNDMGLTQKNNPCLFTNIHDGGILNWKDASDVDANPPGTCPNNPQTANIHVYSTQYVGYRPFTPRNDGDAINDAHQMRMHANAQVGATVVPEYNPTGFAPPYFSKGICIAGIEVPEGMESFAIVRTARQNRILCQGIAVREPNVAAGTITASKLDAIWCHFPDIDFGIVDSDELLNNFGSYEVLVQAPVGIFSEMYSGRKRVGPFVAHDSLIDMASYARVLYDENSINAQAAPVAPSYPYVRWNQWRNNPTTPISGGITTITTAPITAVTTRQTRQGLTFGITLGSNIFPAAGAVEPAPFFIVSIVKRSVQTDRQEVTSNQYVPTGVHIKIKSLLGLCQQGGSYESVDERWEDCIPSSSDIGAGTYRYVYVKDIGSGALRPWVNGTYLSAGEITQITDYLINGIGSLPVTLNPDVQGIFTSSFLEKERFVIRFDVPDFSPNDGSEIIVMYDNTAPIRVFGGDTYVAESIGTFIDNQYDENASFVGGTGDWRLIIDSFLPPYDTYRMNERNFIINNINAITSLGQIQDENTVEVFSGYLRQWVMLYDCETRACVPYDYGSVFPANNYVMRPNKWKTPASSAPNIWAQYNIDYPNERDNWGWGGFKVNPEVNLDYSQEWNYTKFIMKPAAGFKEQLLFCTGAVWSEERQPNLQYDPGIRTFKAGSFFVFPDDKGCIKSAYSEDVSGKGDVLYAIMSNGIAMAVVDKNLISDVSADQIFQLGVTDTSGITYYNWIEIENGMPEELWRTKCETDWGLVWVNKKDAFLLKDMVVQNITGNYYDALINRVMAWVHPYYRDSITAGYNPKDEEYWVSVYLNPVAIDQNWVDTYWANLDNPEVGGLISTGSYLTVTNDIDIPANENVKTLVLKNLSAGSITFTSGSFSYGMQPDEVARFDYTYKDGAYSYTFVENVLLPEEGVFVYSFATVQDQKKGAWIGRFTYRFDNYVRVGREIFGTREGEVYIIGNGYFINGSLPERWIQVAFSEPFSTYKDMLQMQIASTIKPSVTEFYIQKPEPTDVPDAEIITASSPLAWRNYGYFATWIPRQLTAPNNRVQSRVIVVKIMFNLAGKMGVSSFGIRPKVIT